MCFFSTHQAECCSNPYIITTFVKYNMYATWYRLNGSICTICFSFIVMYMLFVFVMLFIVLWDCISFYYLTTLPVQNVSFMTKCHCRNINKPLCLFELCPSPHGGVQLPESVNDAAHQQLVLPHGQHTRWFSTIWERVDLLHLQVLVQAEDSTVLNEINNCCIFWKGNKMICFQGKKSVSTLKEYMGMKCQLWSKFAHEKSVFCYQSSSFLHNTWLTFLLS